LVHFGLDIDARYPALLMLVGVFFGLMYKQNKRRWVKQSWRWPALATLVIIPVVSLYQSDSWAQRARVAQEDGDYALAATNFVKASGGVLYNPDVLTGEGINRLTVAMGGEMAPDAAKMELELALHRARQAQQLDPHDAQHYQLEGRVLMAQNALSAAEAAFRRALELDHLNHPEYALDLASVLVREQKSGDAVRVAQAMIALYPPDVIGNRQADESIPPALANLHALVGNVALGEGRIAEADAAADAALRIDKDSLRGRALKHQVDMVLRPPGQ
jgi:tetratricopeptide (TPR) repeat protein